MVAVVAIRTKGLHRVVPENEIVALRLMSERRRDLVRSRTQTVNHLHQLLMELIPARAGRNLSATKAKTLLATVRPRGVAGGPAANSPLTSLTIFMHWTASSLGGGPSIVKTFLRPGRSASRPSPCGSSEA
jgi:transposase